MAPRPDLTRYEASTVDWPRLMAYANRVARETKVQPSQRFESVTVKKTRDVQVKRLFRTEIVKESYDVVDQRPDGPAFWILEHRYWVRKDTSRDLIYESHLSIDYMLRADGSLVVSDESWDETIQTPGGWSRFPSTWRHRPFQEGDLAIFDFEHHYHLSRGRTAVETNANPDRKKLKHHAKGIGLSLALKKVLEGKC